MGPKVGCNDGAAAKLVVLCILDGWGYRDEPADNAVRLAQTPNFDQLWRNNPHCFLRTDGAHVGLPDGQFGNSEVGHMNLGAGRVVLQDLPKIDQAVAQNDIGQKPAFESFITSLKASGGAAHVMGLLSPGGVHAHQSHISHLVNLLDKASITTYVHAFLDGRDTAPQSSIGYLDRFLSEISHCAKAQLATVSGRYFAMDRDNRWARVQRAYELMVEAKGTKVTSLKDYVLAAHSANLSDEFVEPASNATYRGMNNGDGFICANFRADRCRQILTALTGDDFTGFVRERQVNFAASLGMVSYSEQLNRKIDVLFPNEIIDATLGQTIAAAGLPQTRMAETEKYPHVTFFFNGGREQPYPHEARILVPSPKVATYDLQPEMSAEELTDAFLANDQSTGFILINFANPDMVGHTGDLAAAIKAVETVDGCLGKIIDGIARLDGAVLVTADHGNCEVMRDPGTGNPHTAHTTNPVPCFLTGGGAGQMLKNGRLADVAPTILALLGLPKPSLMTGDSLLEPTR